MINFWHTLVRDLLGTIVDIGIDFSKKTLQHLHCNIKRRGGYLASSSIMVVETELVS
jgi:hypothetical protein